MGSLPNIIPVSDLRQNAANVLKQAIESDEPVFITQRGRTAGVIQSPKLYAKAEHDRRLLEMLLKGEQDISKGKLVEMDAVFKKAGNILKKG
jgi:prevent-host-death family protein